MEQRILKLLIAALGFLLLLVIGLAVLFAFALRDVQRSIQTVSSNADIVQAVRSLKVINGRDGLDGLSVQGEAGTDGKNGRNGTDSTSTVVIEQQPIKGDKGEKGDPGANAPQVEFDGLGNWRYKGDEVWLPLFQLPVKPAAVE